MKKKHKKEQTTKATIDTLKKTGSTWLCVPVTAPIHLLSHSSCVFMLRQVTALSHSSSFRDVVRMVRVFHITVSKHSVVNERSKLMGESVTHFFSLDYHFVLTFSDSTWHVFNMGHMSTFTWIYCVCYAVVESRYKYIYSSTVVKYSFELLVLPLEFHFMLW